MEAPGPRGPVPVDTGFIVFNQVNYPHLTALLSHILVFNRTALAVAEGNPRLTVGGLIERQRLGAWFAQYYLLPMSGAIWSTPRAEMRDFPALALARKPEGQQHARQPTSQPAAPAPSCRRGGP